MYFQLNKKSLEEPLHVQANKPASPIKGPLSPIASPVRIKPLRHAESPPRTIIRSNSLPEDWFSEGNETSVSKCLS